MPSNGARLDGSITSRNQGRSRAAAIGSAEVTGCRSGAPLEFLRPDGGMRLPDLGDAVAMPDGQHDSARPAEVDLDDRMRGVAGTLPVGRALVALEGPRDGHDQVLGRLRQLLELRTC